MLSRTLTEVEGNARLARDGVAEEVATLREQPGNDLAVGGGLASTCIELGLVDEYRLIVVRSYWGGGTPYLPPLGERTNLELVETRTFGSRVAYLSLSPRVERLHPAPRPSVYCSMVFFCSPERTSTRRGFASAAMGSRSVSTPPS